MEQNLSERQINKLIEKNEKKNEKILNNLGKEINQIKKDIYKLKLQYNADVEKLEEILKKAIKQNEHT